MSGRGRRIRDEHTIVEHSPGGIGGCGRCAAVVPHVRAARRCHRRPADVDHRGVLGGVHRAHCGPVSGAQEFPEPAVEIQGPAFARFLFSDRRAGWFWLPIRLFLGLQWLEAGIHKFEDPAWMSGGSALRGFWERAAAIPQEGRPLITFEWYRDVINWLLSINAEPWFAQLVTFGEMAVGVGLIVGVPDRHRSVLRCHVEHVVPARRLRVHQPDHVRAGDRPDPRRGRSPATSASTAGCCRGSEPRGTRE